MDVIDKCSIAVIAWSRVGEKRRKKGRVNQLCAYPSDGGTAAETPWLSRDARLLY